MPDYGLLEQMMQKVFKDNLPSLFQNFRKTQDSSIQKLRETIQSLMQQSKTQPTEGTTAGLGDRCETETAVSDVEEATQTTDLSLMEDAELDVADTSHTSLATDHETMNIAEPLSSGVVRDSQSLPHTSHASQTDESSDEETGSQGQEHMSKSSDWMTSSELHVHKNLHPMERVEDTKPQHGFRPVHRVSAVAAPAVEVSRPSFPDQHSTLAKPLDNSPLHQKTKDHNPMQQTTPE